MYASLKDIERMPQAEVDSVFFSMVEELDFALLNVDSAIINHEQDSVQRERTPVNFARYTDALVTAGVVEHTVVGDTHEVANTLSSEQLALIAGLETPEASDSVRSTVKISRQEETEKRISQGVDALYWGARAKELAA